VVNGLRRTLKLTLRKPPTDTPILDCMTQPIGARLWARLFGKRRVVILVPGDCIDTVTIREEGAQRNAAG